ncbi:TAXI family TRAP transporter solute-binding subunit [Bacillus sp. FJAT-22090]|uniref:TAXI family TRAP transporter solute-binding subunit n=1 Tax=Bacillus sp. FJAT-22090 TaxID=1581038 RepID=UPI0011A11E35|nr:TAXI family TRAP transporter solute-binding subunit [Bacillus sp. FJAT-22090]
MKSKLLILILFVFSVILTACNSESAESSGGKSLTWASGAQGGGWYTMAGGISSLIKEKDGINISTIPGGSLQNMPFISKNEAQLAWMQPPFIKAGIEGTEPFDKKYDKVSIIGNGFGTNHFHFVINEKSPFNSIDEVFEDLKNVSIAVTPVNNSDEWVFRKVLEFYNTDYDGIKAAGGKIIHGSYQEQTDALRNGNIDSVFSQLSLPAASITEAAVSKKIKILPMSEELISYLEQFGLDKNTIPAGTYKDVVNGDEEIQTASMGNVLTVNSDLDEETVYKITKTINENTDKLINIHASLSVYDPQNALSNLTAPLHPGAEKYYKEKGYLK